jgi:F-type H+-transporting ATPase subunit b
MAEPANTTAATEAPGSHKAAGFPPFKTETFPSQLFWLVLTFAFLFVVLWRLATPRIAGVITTRRNRIADDLAEAQKHRGDAEAASAAYQTALAGARARAHALAEENRKGIHAEIDRAKAAADTKARDDIARAEARIAATRDEAKSHVVQAAQDAVVQIVARLTGETVSPDDAAAAVRAATGS